jgi:hypothetical protein
LRRSSCALRCPAIPVPRAVPAATPVSSTSRRSPSAGPVSPALRRPSTPGPVSQHYAAHCLKSQAASRTRSTEKTNILAFQKHCSCRDIIEEDHPCELLHCLASDSESPFLSFLSDCNRPNSAMRL